MYDRNTLIEQTNSK